MPLRAVLFDFDGLILDTESPEVQAWHEVFASFGIVFPDALWMTMIGQSTPEAITMPWGYLREQGFTFDQAALSEVNRLRRLELIAELSPMPGAEALLDQCNALGLRKAVVSSSGRPWVEKHLTRLGLLNQFERLVCGHEGLPSKPAPDLYLAALERMELTATDVVVLEDSPNGIRAAKAAGLHVFAIPNALTCRLDLSQADETFPSLADVNLANITPGLPTGR